MTRFIALLFCLALSANAYAVGSTIEITTDARPTPPPAKPHLQQMIQYETTLFLDKATFTRRQLSRLGIDELIKNIVDTREITLANRITQTREGTFVTLIVNGRAEHINHFFDKLLNMNLISQIYGIGGFPWNLPSEEYKTYWSNAYTTIQREIETQALVHWAAAQPAGSVPNLCDLILAVNRSYKPNSKMTFQTNF